MRHVLTGISLVDGRLGLKATVKLLRGEPDERLARAALTRGPVFGSLAGRDEGWLSKVIQRCITAGWADIPPGEYPLLGITTLGRAVLAGRRPARLVLPEEPDVAGARAGGRRHRRTTGARAAAGRSGTDRTATGTQRPGGGTGPDAAADALFEALRAWRLERARADGVPAFVVASDRTLRDVAAARPSTQHELLCCYGIGDQKAERFGTDLLAVVARRPGRTD